MVSERLDNMFEVGTIESRVDYLIKSIRTRIDKCNLPYPVLNKFYKAIDSLVAAKQHFNTALEQQQLNVIPYLESFNHQLTRLVG